MDALDKLIKQMGYDALIKEINLRRSQKKISRRGPKRRIYLNSYWDIQNVMNVYFKKYPQDTNREHTADRMLKDLSSYRHYLTKPTLYAVDIEKKRDLFDQVLWIGNNGKRKVTPGSVVDLLDDLKRISAKYAFDKSKDNYDLTTPIFIDEADMLPDDNDYQF